VGSGRLGRVANDGLSAGFSATERKLAGRLVEGSAGIVHRRVLKIEAIDAVVLRHSMSVDFTVPTVDTSSADRLLVPLAFVPKRVFGNVDIRDESGKSLPALNRDQGLALTLELVLQWWLARHKRIAGVEGRSRSLYQSVRSELERQGLVPWLEEIVTSDKKNALREIPRCADRASATLDTCQDSENFLKLANLFARRGLVFGVLQDYSPGERRVVRFCFEDANSYLAHANGSWVRRRIRGVARSLIEAVGGTLWRLPPIPHADVKSVHIELTVPPGLVAEDAVLLTGGTDRSEPTIVLDESTEQRLTRTFLYTNDATARSGSRAEFLLAAAPRGWIRSAAFATALVFVASLACLWGIKTLQGLNHATVAASAFLAIAAVAAVYLARPLEHPLTTERLGAARFFLWLSVLTTTAAVGILLFVRPASTSAVDACSGSTVGTRCPPLPSLDWAGWIRWPVVGFAGLGALALVLMLYGPRQRAQLRRWRRRHFPRGRTW
jgi:hypothetical protein